MKPPLAVNGGGKKSKADLKSKFKFSVPFSKEEKLDVKPKE